MFGLALADIVVLAIYLVGVTAIGIWMARQVRNIGDFFMPRRFGKAMMIMHAFGTGTHADQAVSVASKTFTNGLSGIWYQWLWLFATPFYWLIAPVMRRFRAITTADVFEARYDQSVAGLFAVVGTLHLTFNIGVTLKGAGAVLSASTGDVIPANLAIVVMTVLFVAYGTAGGLGAAIVTDFIQGILTIVFSFLLLPIVLDAVGGLAGIRSAIPNADRMFQLVAPGEIGIFYIVVIAFNALVGIVTQPHTMGNCAAGRTEMDGRIGFMGGNIIKRICTIAWCLTGLAAVAYFIDQQADPDHVFGMLAREFLPQIMPGLLGVFLAAVLASVMSTCDSFMIASSGLFTENLYKKLISDKSPAHYVWVGRVAAVVIVSGGMLCAFKLPNVVAGLEIFWKIGPMMGIAFWLGLFWRRMSAAGAWASTLAAFGAWFLSERAFFIAGLSRMPEVFGVPWIVSGSSGSMTMYLPWQMVFYLAAGTIAGIGASLLTKAAPEDKLERYYALARTPVRPGEQIHEPCALPPDAHIPPRRNLVAVCGLEIPTPSRTAILGFVAGWLMVATIIAAFYLITQG